MISRAAAAEGRHLYDELTRDADKGVRAINRGVRGHLIKNEPLPRHSLRSGAKFISHAIPDFY